MKALHFLIVCLLLAALGSCGRASGPSSAANAGIVPSSTAGFALKVLPDTFLGGARSSFSLQTTNSTDGKVTLSIEASNASSLRALYCEVGYDATRWHPVEAAATPAFGKADKVLSLAVLDAPGTVHLGQLQIHPLEQPGFSGSGVMATLRFEPGAARQPVRKSSMAAESFPLIWWSANEVKWPYVLRGDTDQNGEVGLSDLTPIGMHFGETYNIAGRGLDLIFGDNPIEAPDTDQNAEINMADLAAIGANFGASYPAELELFASTDAADYPENALAQNGSGAELLQTVPRDAWLTAGAMYGVQQEVLKYYRLKLDPADCEKYLWLRGQGAGGKHFLSGPQGPQLSRPVYSESSADELYFFSDNSIPTLTIGWRYANFGDANQDGIVGISDIATIAGSPLWHSVVDWSYPVTAAHMLDADRNGEINMSESTVIGIAFRSEVRGYHIYTSDDLEDYPAGAGAELLGSVPFDSAIGDRAVDRLLFEFPLLPWPSGTEKRYVWIASYCKDAAAGDGVPSQLLDLGPMEFELSLDWSNPEATGTGTSTDPFVLPPDSHVRLGVRHPLLGDRTTDAGTNYTASAQVEWVQIGGSTRLFYIPATLNGEFSVHVTYHGKDTVPPELFFRIEPLV